MTIVTCVDTPTQSNTQYLRKDYGATFNASAYTFSVVSVLPSDTIMHYKIMKAVDMNIVCFNTGNQSL